MTENSKYIPIHNKESELYIPTISFIDEFMANSKISVQTSGSTGEPKRYNVKKVRFIRSAERTCDFFNLKPGQKAFLCISPRYIGGKMMIVRSLLKNLELHLGNLSAFPFHQKKVFDFAAFVPLQIQRIMDTDPDYLKQIRNIIIGGGALSPPLEKALVENKIHAFVTFGMTETLSHIALRKVGERNYKVLRGIGISKDSNGRLVIKDPELTGMNELITNDLVEIISDDEFIWLGRIDNLINSGGVKLFPEQIESKLATLIKTSFFIDKAKDPNLGEKIILIVEGKERPIVDLDKLLDRYEVPKNIYFLDEFIYTSTQKINRLKTLEKLNIER